MITETLKLQKECKHSDRYDNKDSKFLKAIYITKEAVKQLGDPEEIVVTINRN